MLASATQHSATQIAAMWQTDESHVRKVITEFNQRGLESLRPNYRGGRPRRITEAQRERIVAVAGARPDTQGAALTRWSLRRLAAHLAEAEGIEISRHTSAASSPPPTSPSSAPAPGRPLPTPTTRQKPSG